MTKNETLTAPASVTITVAEPKVADPIVEVEVEVVLPVLVLVGERELSLDDAIGRLAEIQQQERALTKEKEPMRKVTEAVLRSNGVDTYTTPAGHSATLTTTVRYNVDKAYLESILTEEQLALAFPPKISKGLRVTA